MIGIASSLVGGAIDGLFETISAKQNYQYGEMAAQNAYKRQIDHWNQQNDYNRPIEQRQRLQDAGLSTGLMYSGGGNISNSGGLSHVPENKGVGKMDINGAGYAQNIVNAMALKEQQSRIELNEANANKANSESEGRQITNTTLNDQITANIESVTSNTQNIKLSNELKQIDLKFKENTVANDIKGSFQQVENMNYILQNAQFEKSLQPDKQKQLSTSLLMMAKQILESISRTKLNDSSTQKNDHYINLIDSQIKTEETKPNLNRSQIHLNDSKLRGQNIDNQWQSPDRYDGGIMDELMKYLRKSIFFHN